MSHRSPRRFRIPSSVLAWVLFSTVAAAPSAGSGAASEPGRPERPSVVLILVDDLGWADLSCQGSRYHETPNVDRLASEGIRFTDAYAACAVCSPTRAALMTGRHPARVGVTDWIRGRFQRGGIGTPERNPTEYVSAVTLPQPCVGGPSREPGGVGRQRTPTGCARQVAPEQFRFCTRSVPAT